MRIIRRRGLIRLCCMLCSRMSVSRDRRLRRGDMDMGEWDGGIEKSGDDGGKETLWKGMLRKKAMVGMPGDCYGVLETRIARVRK